MAYAAVISLAQTIHQILHTDQFLVSDSMRHQLTSLHERVISLQEFLDKSPEEAIYLEPRIRDAANEAEDHLEFFMYDQMPKPFDFWTWIVPNFRQSPHNISKSIENKIYDFDRLKEAMEEINSSREADICSNCTTIVADTPTAPSLSSTPASVADGTPVGLDDDLLKIKDLLCRESSTLQITPIVGMAGIGKTTLATTIYHDQLIVERFTVRAWVTVSQDYDAESIFSCLLNSCKDVGDVRSGKRTQTGLERVYKFLKGRKYLIVLDDIWSTKAWDDVKMAFPDDRNGSRIVLTTRIKDVALYTTGSSNYLHQMKFMGSDQSWNLLKQKSFPGNKDCPPKLECIGRDIARSCGGLPLAIVLAAGILSTIDKTRSSWSKVAERVRSAGHLKNIISLSYTHLPHHLRPCFLHMGCFPEDYEIHVSRLTKLWIAEGFIVEPRIGKSPEEVAEKYLDDLVKRNLALVKKTKSDGKMKSCYVHDMVRDICKRRAQEENYQCRLSIAHSVLAIKSWRSTLRSYILVKSPKLSVRVRSMHGFWGSSLKLLRVLDLMGGVFNHLVYHEPGTDPEFFGRGG